MLESALFLVAVVDAVADDDMVEEIDAHDVACSFDAFGQQVVITAGRNVVAGVVVAECDEKKYSQRRIGTPEGEVIFSV